MLRTILKMLSDNNRLRIINVVKDDSLCVGEIQTLLGTAQSNTSRHLEKLKTSGLLISTKDSQRVFYRLDKDLIKKYQFFSDLIYKDVMVEKQFIDDLDRLKHYKASNLNCEDLRNINFDYSRI